MNEPAARLRKRLILEPMSHQAVAELDAALAFERTVRKRRIGMLEAVVGLFAVLFGLLVFFLSIVWGVDRLLRE